jgi:hypothetical protein
VASKQETIRLLREEARECMTSRGYTQALEAFARLGALEPAEPEWPRRAAECYGALKRPKDQAEALAHAAERFDKARLVNKAEAMCRLSLSINPANARARGLLDELERLRKQTTQLPSVQRLPEPTPAAQELPRAHVGVLAQTRLEVAMRERRARTPRASSKK